MKELNKEKFFSIIFYIAYFFIVFADLFDNIEFLSRVLNIIDYVVVGLLSIVIIYRIISKRKEYIKSHFILFLMFLAIAISSYFSNDRSLLKLGFLLLAFNETNISKFIKRDIWIRIISVLVLLIMLMTGVVDFEVLEVRYGLTRYMFGTSHPNVFSIYLTMICIDYFYIVYSGSKKYIKPIIISTIITAFIFLFLGTKTCVIILFLTIMAFLFADRINIKITKNIIINSFLIVSIICLFLGYFYNSNSEIWILLDKVFSRRLFYTHYYLYHYDLTVFGQELVRGKYMILDNAYMYLLLRFGIILFTLFLFTFKNMFEYLYKNKKNILILIMLIMIIYGVFETPLYIPAKNPFILLLALPMINYNKGEKNEKK